VIAKGGFLREAALTYRAQAAERFEDKLRARSRRFSSQTMMRERDSLRLLLECEGLERRENSRHVGSFSVPFGRGRVSALFSTFIYRE